MTRYTLITLAACLTFALSALAAEPAAPAAPSDPHAGLNMPGLPSGHPNIALGQPDTQPAGPATGTIGIKVVQGTKDGPAIGDDTVHVELLHQGITINKFDTKLSSGNALVADVPIVVACDP